MPNLTATNILRGYRLTFVGRNSYAENRYKNGGASILNTRGAPPTKEEFEEWWRREVSRARRDGVVLVLFKSYQYAMENQYEWLRNIEEDEWYSNDDRPSRVRFITDRKLTEAMNRLETLTDEWGDDIAKGEDAWREDESNESSKSEAEFEG